MDHLLRCMKIIGDDTIQRIQLNHRLALVKAFEIKPGMRVLEIGCGQGDTTVALAEAVGEAGRVVAIDIATPDYGAPITLGEAAQTIAQSPIGKRITFHFETDFLTFDTTEHFDAVVLSHCSWYFKHPEQLLAYFNKMKTMTTRVCFAEWDMDYRELSQRSHFCAVNIQALYSAYFGGDGNVSNVFHKRHIEHMLNEAQFSITKELVVDATYLQDGAWEIAYAKELYPALLTVPQPIQTLATTYFHLMQADEQKSLYSFVLIANI